jgi:predicted ATPase
MLLVLDNFEQIAEAAPFLADLLAAAPELKLLATSRAALQLRAEHEFPVPPLGLPDRGRPLAAETLSQYAAVALFIERATAVKPDFAVTSENAPAVAEICHRLDGLPLAIELAAARVRLLPPSAMLARLGRRLPLLTGGARDLPARQQTLRAAIQWSYDLLDPDEQRLFRRLAVFVGGCTLEGTEAVCNADGALQVDVLDGVASLAAKSLLRLDEQGGEEPAVVMLETIREYGFEQLEASGEAEQLRRRHAEYYLALAEAAERQFWSGGDYGVWLTRFAREHDNLRAALAWTHGDGGSPEMGLRLASALWWFWFVHSHYTEGRHWLETTLGASSMVPPALRAKALTEAGQLERVQGDYDRAMALLQEAAALYREQQDIRGLVRALVELAFGHLFRGDARKAAELWDEGVALGRSSGDTWGLAASLHGLGRVAHHDGDHARAAALLEESLALFRQLRNRWYIAWTLRYLGRVLLARGDLARARELLETSLTLWRDEDNKPGIAWALQNLGRVARAQGDHRRATALHLESLALAREMGQKREIAEYLEGLAGLAAEQEPDRAARLFGAAELVRQEIGAPLPPSEREDYERDVTAARSRLSDEAFAAEWAAGRAMPLEQAVSFALADEIP